MLVEEHAFTSDIIGDLIENWLEVGSNNCLVVCNSVWHMVVVVVFVCSLEAYCFGCSNEESSGEGLHSSCFSCW